MADAWAGANMPIAGPGENHAAITPGSSAIDPRPRALYVGGAGDVVIEDQRGVSVTYTVAAGAVIPFRAVKVTASTTATNIVAWW